MVAFGTRQLVALVGKLGYSCKFVYAEGLLADSLVCGPIFTVSFTISPLTGRHSLPPRCLFATAPCCMMPGAMLKGLRGEADPRPQRDARQGRHPQQGELDVWWAVWQGISSIF